MGKLEIACFNAESAVIAANSGADRIELCANRDLGGTTPDLEIIKSIRKKIEIPINVMIRPRGGDFLYSDAEFQQMKTAIIALKKQNSDGFVFGILDENNKIDRERNSALIALANPIPCTLHKAFDETPDIFDALETAILCGFQTILTSGKAATVTDGILALSQLVATANNRITIMPGGGLRSENAAWVKERTNALFYHSAAITDTSDFADPNEIQSLKAILK